MKLDKVANSGNDEFYTPYYAIEPIMKYIPRERERVTTRIWCPFDTKNSEFVILLEEAGHKVIYSHIDLGQDFFEYEPSEYDYIISNPPFSSVSVLMAFANSCTAQRHGAIGSAA